MQNACQWVTGCQEHSLDRFLQRLQDRLEQRHVTSNFSVFHQCCVCYHLAQTLREKKNGLTVSPQNKYVVGLRLSGLRPCPTFSPLTCVTFGRAGNGPRLLEIQEMDGKVNVYLCMSAYVWGRERNGGRGGGCWKKVLVILEMKRAENTDWVMTGSVS